ncbi:hypothetical protein G7054_g7726 [Neopestalotiopsis clavispora]|nr:hypothetical protein G7054_g7726 [Neopestalotiopsis clavispora]
MNAVVSSARDGVPDDHNTSGDTPQACAHEACPAQLRHTLGWRKLVVNFTPSWFSVNMGTGITSILLYSLPFNGTWLYWVSVVLFCLNFTLFVAFFVVSILRYTLFRGMWSAMMRHPVQSLFLGTFPMGLATIINMIVFICVPVWGNRAAYLAWGLWWFDVAKLSEMTAAWLLPVVSTIVAAASGAIIASVLPDDQHAIWTVTVCYILWGCGVPLALFTMITYFQRLTFHHLPPREVLVSVFLPLGPLGQGAFCIMQLGKDAMALFNRCNYVPAAPMAGQIFYVAGILIAFIMWGFGLVWLFFALSSISRMRFPFNLGWWGFTFPLGVYAVATTTLAKELPSFFFKVMGTIFSVLVTLLWIVVASGTVWFAFSGRLVFAPCVADWEIHEELRLSGR